MTQTGPEIFFLRRHTVEEAERFNKGREIVRLQTQHGSLARGESLMSSAIAASSWFIMFYYLSVEIDRTAGQTVCYADCEPDSTPSLSCTLMKNIQFKQSWYYLSGVFILFTIPVIFMIYSIHEY
jgi:hypothetical protein